MHRLSMPSARSLSRVLVVAAALSLGPARAAEPAPARWVAPPSTLEPATGATTSATEPPIQAVAVTRQLEGKRVYLNARLSESLDQPALWRCRADGDEPHAVAVLTPDAQVWLRVASPDAPKTLRFMCERGQAGYPAIAEPGATRPLIVTDVLAAPPPTAKTRLAAGFFDALHNDLRFDARGNSTRAFQVARAELLASGTVDRPNPSLRANRASTDLGRLMDFYSGLDSVEEALQTDRGLGIPAEPLKDRTVPARTLAPLALPTVDWPALRAALPAAARPVIEPIARALPADTFAATFRDLRDLAGLARDLDETLGPAFRAARETGGDRLFTRREEQRLCIERTALAEAFGHLAAGRVALVAGDAWLAAGTDIALVFEVRDSTLLEGALDGFVARARSTDPTLRAGEVRVAGHKVTTYTTDDGRVAQHRLRLGDLLIVANGPALIERIVAAAEGRAPSLATLDEFAYFRTLYPADAPSESGFVFVSDAAVLRLSSPALKILDARRTEAVADLTAINAAALLHARLEGRLPDSAEALVRAGLLARSELKHASGEAITYSPAAGARSALGSLAGMRPLSASLPQFDRVTPRERDAYAAFRMSYQSGFRAADPAALRIERRPNRGGWRFETRVLPLVEGTEYDELGRLVGATRMTVEPSGGGVRAQFALGQDSRVRRELDQVGEGVLGAAALGWLGDWVALGMLESGALWDLVVKANAAPSTQRLQFENREAVAAIARLPVYVEAQVANPLGLAATLTALRRLVETSAPGLVAWTADAPYRGVAITRLTSQEQRGGFLPLPPLYVFYAAAGDRWIASLDRRALESRVDVALAAPTQRAGAESQLAFEFAPSAPSPTLRAFFALLDSELSPAHSSARAAFEMLTDGTGRRDLSGPDGVDFALGHLGFLPESPWGGAFTRDDPRLGALHSTRGRASAPIAPAMPPGGAPLTRALSGLERLSVAVELVDVPGVGPGRGLRARIELDQAAR